MKWNSNQTLAHRMFKSIMTPATAYDSKSCPKQSSDNFYRLKNRKSRRKNLSCNSLRKMVRSSSPYVFEKLTFTMKLKSFSRHFLCFLKSSPVCNEPGGCWTCYSKAWIRIIRLKNTKKLPKFYWNNYFFFIFISFFDSHIMSTTYQGRGKVSITL